MKQTLRSLSTAFAAALALACAGLGSGSGEAAGRLGGPGLRESDATAFVAVVRSTGPVARLTGGRTALERIPRRAGTPPRVLPLGDPPELASFVPGPALRAVPHAGAGRAALSPDFARDLDDARDGTLSANSAGVPPPLPA